MKRCSHHESAILLRRYRKNHSVSKKKGGGVRIGGKTKKEFEGFLSGGIRKGQRFNRGVLAG